jgi:ribose 5-phosphate isomerase A
MKGNRIKPRFFEDEVERIDEIGRGIDEGAIEVEGDGRANRHAPSAYNRTARKSTGARDPAVGAGRALGRVLGPRRFYTAGFTDAKTVPQTAATENLDAMKREAARRALDFVRPSMRLGLGTGSTAAHFVELLAERVKQGLDIIGVPTSEATRAQAERLGVPLTTLDEEPELDLTVDGADEIDPDLNLIKGGGGALLREKIVAVASRDMVVIADASKWVSRLGRFPLPIEVVDFGLGATKKAIASVVSEQGCPGPIRLRHKPDGHVFVTDQGHLLLDAGLGTIPDARRLAQGLSRIPGVVEHGLFIGLARRAVLAGSEGVRVIERS